MIDVPTVLEGAAVAALASAGTMAYAVRAPRSTLLAPSVYCGVDTRPAIALTFDDGPSESTPALLELLARHHAPATFFQCGANVRRLPNVAREVLAAGHEIGNHTENHPPLYLKSHGFIYRELAAAQETIEVTSGIVPKLFRPPFGVRWFGLRDAQQRLGLTSIMWTTIALDWKWPERRITARLLDGACNGAILCLHDGRTLQRNPDIGVTIETVRELLPELMERGYRFEKVTEILCPTKN
jgi:peptidoglycan/xylan/chitin deacetylase (PgdA/CDA1 family)